MLIHQSAHELDHSQRGMCIVELNGVVAADLVDAMPRRAVAPEYIAHRAGNEEVFLDETQLAACLGRVRRIEHLRHGFHGYLPLHRAQIVAVIEDCHVEFGRRTRRVEPEKIDAASAITHDWNVRRYAYQSIPIEPMRIVLAGLVEIALDPAIDWNHRTLLAPFDVPGSAMHRPVI